MKIKKITRILTIVLFGSLILLPLAHIHADVSGAANPQNPLKFNSIGDLINYVADALLILGLPIATIMILYAAFLFITSGGDEDKVKKAKQAITYAIIGIAVLLVAKGVALVLKDLFGVQQ